MYGGFALFLRPLLGKYSVQRIGNGTIQLVKPCVAIKMGAIRLPFGLHHLIVCTPLMESPC